jgi:hypothetical protein
MAARTGAMDLGHARNSVPSMILRTPASIQLPGARARFSLASTIAAAGGRCDASAAGILPAITPVWASGITSHGVERSVDPSVEPPSPIYESVTDGQSWQPD